MSFERYDRIVEHYPAMWPLIVPGYLPILNAMLDVVRAASYRPAEVLDLGCGPGSATVAVASACDPDGRVTLVDGSAEMLDSAQSLVQSNVRDIVLGDFTQAATIVRVFEAGFYDLVLCSFALHHVDDESKRQTLEHVAQCLAPGGFCLVAEEIAAERPGGWELIERIRARFIDGHLQAGRISKAFWELETSLPENAQLPFVPPRIDDLTSWMAASGLAVSCPVKIFGSALMVGVKPEHG